MNSLQRVATRISKLHRFSIFRELSSNRNGNGGLEDDGGGGEWNDAWETAWLPDDIAGKSRAPWEADVNFGGDGDGDAAEAREFMAEMDEKWSERKGRNSSRRESPAEKEGESESVGKLDAMKKDYRLKKQRIHAGLWVKEIEKIHESKFGSECDDIEKLIDSYSDIFHSGSGGFEDDKTRSSDSDFKAKPDGWETTSKTENDGNVWEMTQREEDILLQEFDRRISYSKFQIASFIKTHIFSRRRPIDGWKYMIEELGPNARKGKGSVSRLPTLSDPSTQPFKEDNARLASKSLEPYRKR